MVGRSGTEGRGGPTGCTNACPLGLPLEVSWGSFVAQHGLPSPRLTTSPLGLHLEVRGSDMTSSHPS